MCKKPILWSFLLLLECGLFAQSPGGITHQSVWLQGTFSLDDVRPHAINFHPAIGMDGNARIKLPSGLSLRRTTVFTVYQNPDLQNETPVWEMTGDFGNILLSTQQLSNKSSKTNMVFVKNKPERGEAIIHTYSGNNRTRPSSENAEQKEASIRFGDPGFPPANSAAGSIAEFIMYEKILSEEEIARVETYLALKYGITLQKDYLNALGEVVWNVKNDKSYSNNVAGIARDDGSTLYQKQGTSSNSPGQLVIGIDKIALSNTSNTGKLNNRDYLIWGDNAQSFTLHEHAAASAADIMLSGRKWMMRSSGNGANKISTELRIDTRTIPTENFSKDSFYLVIDRSGTGEFALENCAYFKPDNISADGFASFSGLYWDKDASGKDAFAFGVKPARLPVKNNKAATLLSFQLYPNPVTNGRYKMTVTLDKPADVQIQVYDLHQRLVQSRKLTGRSSYLFTGYIHGPAGPYPVRVITPESEYSRIIIVQ